MKKVLSLFVTAAILVGCGSKTDAGNASTVTSSAGTSATTPVATDEKSKADATLPDISSTAKPMDTGKKPEADAKVTKTSEPPKLSSKSDAATPAVPKELMHEGYQYEGLSNNKPIDMELVVSGRSDIITGSQSVTFDGMKDGKAMYRVERTGGLSMLGSDTMAVEKDGIYNLKSSVASLSNHAMELPANPKPGMTWKFHVSSDKKDSQMDMATECKVVGIQSVKTKGGTYDKALLVEQDSTGLLAGKNVRTVSRSWYVKGIGTVKADLTTHNADGSTQTLTIQETHH